MRNTLGIVFGVAIIILVIGMALVSLAFPSKTTTFAGSNTLSTFTNQGSNVTCGVVNGNHSTYLEGTTIFNGVTVTFAEWVSQVFPSTCTQTSLVITSVEMMNRPYVAFLELSRTGGHGVFFNFTNISNENISGVAYLKWDNVTNGQQISEAVTDYYDVMPSQSFGLVFPIKVSGYGPWQLELNVTNYLGAMVYPISIFTLLRNSSGYYVK